MALPSRYNEPQRLEWKNATKDEAGQDKQTPKMNALSMFLMNMRTGTKVFQHFLSKSNLSHLIDGRVHQIWYLCSWPYSKSISNAFIFPTDKPYTVLIPSDSAFQRWHPIDWGFYPFSVFEFTESVLRNHFLQLKTPLSMQDIRRSGVVSKIKTLGDETLLFKSKRKLDCSEHCLWEKPFIKKSIFFSNQPHPRWIMCPSPPTTASRMARKYSSFPKYCLYPRQSYPNYIRWANRSYYSTYYTSRFNINGWEAI